MSSGTVWGQSGCYQFCNKLTGALYIGSSVGVRSRRNQHYSQLRRRVHCNAHLQSAWDKYGEEQFAFEVLIICQRKDVRMYEQLLIDALQPAYNKSASATSGFYGPLSATRKEEIGVQTRALWATKTYRSEVTKKIQESMTVEERKLRSERVTKLWANPEYREKAVAARRDNSYAKGYVCTAAQVGNRQRAARISNMKRKYGASWKTGYLEWYPDRGADLNVE